MAKFVEIADPQAGAGATGRVRIDRRGPRDGRRPSLVVIGGLTQTISSWGGHMRHLAADRDAVVYETRGQGVTELALRDVGFARHVEDFVELVEVLGLAPPVDLCGFSFGGRVALAVAAERPGLIRKLVVTGVGADRGVLGKIIVRAWAEALKTGNLRAVSWISLADTLGPTFLAEHQATLDQVVQATVNRNRFEAIAALFDQTSTELEQDSPWAPATVADRISTPALVLGAEHDRLAPPDQVELLAARLGARTRVFDGVGHTVPIEAAEDWRTEVLAFLDEDGP